MAWPEPEKSDGKFGKKQVMSIIQFSVMNIAKQATAEK